MSISLERVANNGAVDTEALQRNVDKLSMLVPDAGGRSTSTRYGTGTLTWPGGSAFTGTLTLAHGMGKVPVSAVATATLAAGSDPVVVHVVAMDATNIQWRGYDAAGLSPVAATTKTFYWVAYG